MEIRMVDTIKQYKNIQNKIDEGINRVIQSGIYIGGPVVNEFCEQLGEYLEGVHVMGCGNGTDALQIALMSLDLEPGDEVITTSFTFVATAEAIALLGLKPVLVDVDPRTFNVDAQTLEAAITPKTRAIIPVHLFGQPAPMEAIMAVAEKHNLFVIEDTAQAIGADYRFSDGRIQKVGTIGNIGTTSFYPSKNLGAYGDGGAIFTRDAELAEKLRMICHHGSNKRYHHDIIGVNSRLDAIQAAILKVKLVHLDSYNERRIAAADRYDALLTGWEDHLHIPYRVEYGRHVFHQYTVRVKAGRGIRDRVKTNLEAEGVPTMIYYPLGLHEQAAYKDYRNYSMNFSVTEQLTREVISLPMHSELDEQQQAYIINHLQKVLNQLLIKRKST